MRTSHVFALTAASVAGLLLAGCTSSGSTVNTTAVATGAAKGGAATAAATAPTASAGSGATAAAASAGSKRAGLGDTIDVTGMQSGEKLAVTLVKIDAKAQATDGFSTPSPGDYYYAAQFKVTNIGTSAYNDSIDNCAIVKDGKGQQFQPDLLDSISSGPMLDQVNIAPGDSSLGYVVFDVPTGDAVTTVQFTIDSGMGDSTAQWSLS